MNAELLERVKKKEVTGLAGVVDTLGMFLNECTEESLKDVRKQLEPEALRGFEKLLIPTDLWPLLLAKPERRDREEHSLIEE